MEGLIDRFGEGPLLLAIGLATGALFGLAAAQSRFCLRAATVEVAEGRLGPRLAIWLIAFFSALAFVQWGELAGWFDHRAARQIAATGSLSGAIIGGLMFGIGMILARGCASRLLVLSASGNLRAFVTGLVLTLTAQAALRGVLSPAREALAGLWTLPGGTLRDLGALIGLGNPAAAAIGLAAFLGALLFGRYRRLPLADLAGGTLVGLAVALGWLATHAVAAASFDIVEVESITFTGPSADTLMALVNRPDLPPGFGIGLVPGVFAGAMLMALLRGEARIQRFGPDTPMERYLVGGVLMGFGSMLAGGCAVGNGLSGGSILAVTAWVAVFFMWVGAVLTQLVLARGGAAAGAAALGGRA